MRNIPDYHRGKYEITWVEATFDAVGVVVAIALVIGRAAYGRRVLAEAESSEELDGNVLGEALPNVCWIADTQCEQTGLSVPFFRVGG